MDKVTLQSLQDLKANQQPIVMLTAYDYPMARLADQSKADMILVGDSLGMVVHGFDSTLPVTMDMMIMHCQAVRRGVERALVVGDMPFMSYQISLEDAKRNAGRLLAEGGADAVKLEGGQQMAGTIEALVRMGIAVQGHIGLTPQSISALGGFSVQGKTVQAARRLLEDARAIEQAGAFSLVLEAIPARLAALITQHLSIPTIGIGAGAGCDGQVLVMHDMLGLFEKFVPRHVKQFADLSKTILQAFETYGSEVRLRKFPGKEQTFSMPDDVWEAFIDALDEEA